VVSYTTVSPLPVPEGHRRSGFCGTFRRVAPPGCYPAPCPWESGLSSTETSRGRPVNSSIFIVAVFLSDEAGAACFDYPTRAASMAVPSDLVVTGPVIFIVIVPLASMTNVSGMPYMPYSIAAPEPSPIT